jgi:hypothetical protein
VTLGLGVAGASAMGSANTPSRRSGVALASSIAASVDAIIRAAARSRPSLGAAIVR